MKMTFTSFFFLFCFCCCNENKTNNNSSPENSPDSKADSISSPMITKEKTSSIDHFELNNCELKMSDEAKALIEKKYPGFRLWERYDFAYDCGKTDDTYECNNHQSPNAVIGDLNGDTIEDLVLNGHNKKNDLIIVLLSENNSFNVVEISKTDLSDPDHKLPNQLDSEIGIWIYLSHQSPRKIKSSYENNELDLKTDAFHIIYCGKGSGLYYWKKNEFNTYTTSD